VVEKIRKSLTDYEGMEVVDHWDIRFVVGNSYEDKTMNEMATSLL